MQYKCGMQWPPNEESMQRYLILSTGSTTDVKVQERGSSAQI